MRSVFRTIVSLPVCMLLVMSAAHAYERPDAVLLSGEGWEVAFVAPLIDVVENRDDRCDWPTLDPALSEVIPAELMQGDTAPVLAKYMNRGIIALQWQPITVPCAWEQVLGIDYNGAGWYRRVFNGAARSESGAAVPGRETDPRAGMPAPLTRSWIEFDAVATVCGVWLNGQWLGGNVGDYVRFRVEATDAMRPGDNELIVYVDELPDHLTQGFLSMICPHHGGIWQDVRMYETGSVAIKPDGVNIRAATDGSFEVEIECSETLPEDATLGIFWTSATPYNVTDLFVTEMDPSFTVTKAGPGGLHASGKIDRQEVKIWSPENPQLYHAYLCVFIPGPTEVVTQFLDIVGVRFAFRTIEVSGSKFLLNGEPLYIRSALNWGYYPRIVAPCPPPDVVREEFRQLKAAGFNAETVCLVNMPDYFYDIADEMGVLIWQEYPSWHCTFAEKDRATYERMYERFMARDRNHPSIILRSMSVEAGVEDQSVMDTLYAMGKSMTDTPIQDNNSWFSHSNEATTDWYGEDNYFNNPQWERHLMGRLPKQLDALPAKPYLIGESILFNTWPDVDALIASLEHPWNPIAGGLLGLNTRSSYSAVAPQGGPAEGGWPYWFPRCMDDVLETEARLRARYNHLLPDGQDIVRDYLLPQSYDYAMQSRRFQIELMHADPRYAGYTVNCIRDMPLIRAGLLDDLGRPRWTPEQWAWHGDHTDSPVHVGDYDPLERKPGEAGRLDTPQWKRLKRGRSPVIGYLKDGYRDLSPMLSVFESARPLSAEDVETMPREHLKSYRGPQWTEAPEIRAILSTVLTHALVNYAADGGSVVLLASKWPGAFGTEAHMHWRDAVFISPLAQVLQGYADFGSREYSSNSRPVPTAWIEAEWLLKCQPYDLIRDYSQVVPVGRLSIENEVDPIIRLFDTHDLDQVETYDQVFATRIGKGMLIVTSLDHTSAAGQLLLAGLVSYAAQPNEQMRKEYYAATGTSESDLSWAPLPATSMSPERLHEFAVKRANGILGLDSGWRFRLDPKQEGEAAGWMNPGLSEADLDAAGWEKRTLPAWWEQWGINYDGMAWYRTTVDTPADWSDATIRLICDGVDDGYVVWVNGQRVALHGSFTDHEATVFMKQTVTDITAYLKPGETNTIALQVVDIVGNGGVWKPVYITAD